MKSITYLQLNKYIHNTMIFYLFLILNCVLSVDVIHAQENSLFIQSIEIDKEWSWQRFHESREWGVDSNGVNIINDLYRLPFSAFLLSGVVSNNGCICNNFYNENVSWFFRNDIQYFKNRLKYSIDDDFGAIAEYIANSCITEVPRIILWIRNLLETEKRFNLLPYINTEQKFCQLKINRPDIFNKIYTNGFINRMKDDNYYLFKKWYECTIGLSDPVFLIRLMYNGKVNTRLTKVIYNVLYIDQVAGGESLLDVPIATYEHFINYEEGIQEKELQPPIIINADEKGTLITLRIFIRPKFGKHIKDKIGRVWGFTMTFCTSNGDKATSNTIQVIMSR
jgi:hypothetical protein